VSHVPRLCSEPDLSGVHRTVRAGPAAVRACTANGCGPCRSRRRSASAWCGSPNSARRSRNPTDSSSPTGSSRRSRSTTSRYRGRPGAGRSQAARGSPVRSPARGGTTRGTRRARSPPGRRGPRGADATGADPPCGAPGRSAARRRALGRPGRTGPVRRPLVADFRPAKPGDAWGPPWGTTWFRIRGEVPSDSQGHVSRPSSIWACRQVAEVGDRQCDDGVGGRFDQQVHRLATTGRGGDGHPAAPRVEALHGDAIGSADQFLGGEPGAGRP